MGFNIIYTGFPIFFTTFPPLYSSGSNHFYVQIDFSSLYLGHQQPVPIYPIYTYNEKPGIDRKVHHHAKVNDRYPNSHNIQRLVNCNFMVPTRRGERTAHAFSLWRSTIMICSGNVGVKLKRNTFLVRAECRH